MSNLSIVILAAGKGTRMKSHKAKVLHPVCGVPLIHYVCETALKLNGTGVYMVIGESADKIKAELKDKSIKFVHQAKQLGTADAVMAAYEELNDKQGSLLVLYGDTPLIKIDTLQNLAQRHFKSKAAATLLTARLENPYGYGRILRNKNGKINRIVEEKDAQPAVKRIKEINTGIYCFEIKPLYEALQRISNRNAQGEFYLTDVVAILRKAKRKIESVAAQDPNEVLGINTRSDLACVEEKIRMVILERLMLEGVTIHDPRSTYIDANVKIGSDTVIYPNIALEGNTTIGQECTVYSGAQIKNSLLGDHVTVWPSSVIYDSKIGSHTNVGPFAHLRNNTIVGERCRIGNFVEIKNSILGNETKAAHHAYLGDAEIGERVNIGAGTITCNFDGVEKHKTIIEDDVFIGSDSQLIAPVRICKGAYVAAGSSITDDVPPGSLAIARGRQAIKPDWVKKRISKTSS